MEIVQVAPSKLNPAEYNPRKSSNKEYKHLKESIQRFGLVDPIIVNKVNNRIIGGHFRVRVAKDLGFKEVPCVYVEITDEAREKELNVRLNKNLGEFDLELLSEFDMSILKDVGFSSQEIHRIFDPDLKEDGFDGKKEHDSITTPESKLGEVYELGRHRVMCGDATKEEDVAKLMNGNLARLVFTDPPYNVNYVAQNGLNYDRKRHTRGYGDGKIFNDNQSDEDCLKFYTDVLKNIHKHTVDDMTIYWWFANKNNWINRLAFEEANLHMSQIIIWLKNGMVYSRGQDYHRCYEPCMLGWKNKKTHYKNKKYVDFKDCFNLDFDDFEQMIDVWYQKRDLTSQYVHPTQKPIRLAERALKKNSEQGDIVLDLFGGSGSTLMGCEQMNRVCYTMELDPKYVDVIRKRWKMQ